MWPHAALVGGVADHDVVDAPARHEVERVDQTGDIRQVLVDILYQQGPVAVGKRGEIGIAQGAVPKLPGTRAVLDDQARLELLFARKARKFLGSQTETVGRQCRTHQQRFLLPIVAQEGRAIDSARKTHFSCVGAQIGFECRFCDP